MAKMWQETLYDSYGQTFSVDKVYFESKTDHQHLIIFHNAMFGRVMALDGIVQTTEKDEFIYHEMLTHVPVFAHGNVTRVLIVGGGDGGMLREVCKHIGIESITQVEIDQAVIDMAREFLPSHSNGAYDDPRVNIVIDDGMKFVAETEERFDVIISDSTDPVGPGEVLFAEDFYQACKRCLKPGGILVTQNGVVFMQVDEVITTSERMKAVFQQSAFYSAAVPTYIGGIMTFAWGTDCPENMEHSIDTISERFRESGINTRYYNPNIHLASFALPQYVVMALDRSGKSEK
jgi:spermidine synthase